MRAFPNEVDEFCGIGSSKDVVQPLFHEESPNNSWCQQNQEYCPGQYSFHALSENVLTFVKKHWKKNIVNLRKTCFFRKITFFVNANRRLWHSASQV